MRDNAYTITASPSYELFSSARSHIVCLLNTPVNEMWHDKRGCESKIVGGFLGHALWPRVDITRKQKGATKAPQPRKDTQMTKKNTARTAQTTIACALASALALGSFCAPALAETLPANGTEHAITAQSAWHMSEGEAVYIARTFLRIAPEAVYDLDCDLVNWNGNLCFEVQIETWSSDAEHHVIVDAFDGTIYTWWTEI